MQPFLPGNLATPLPWEQLTGRLNGYLDKYVSIATCHGNDWDVLQFSPSPETDLNGNTTSPQDYGVTMVTWVMKGTIICNGSRSTVTFTCLPDTRAKPLCNSTQYIKCIQPDIIYYYYYYFYYYYYYYYY